MVDVMKTEPATFVVSDGDGRRIVAQKESGRERHVLVKTTSDGKTVMLLGDVKGHRDSEVVFWWGRLSERAASYDDATIQPGSRDMKSLVRFSDGSGVLVHMRGDGDGIVKEEWYKAIPEDSRLVKEDNVSDPLCIVVDGKGEKILPNGNGASPANSE